MSTSEDRDFQKIKDSITNPKDTGQILAERMNAVVDSGIQLERISGKNAAEIKKNKELTKVDLSNEFLNQLSETKVFAGDEKVKEFISATREKNKEQEKAIEKTYMQQMRVEEAFSKPEPGSREHKAITKQMEEWDKLKDQKSKELEKNGKLIDSFHSKKTPKSLAAKMIETLKSLGGKEKPPPHNGQNQGPQIPQR